MSVYGGIVSYIRAPSFRQTIFEMCVTSTKYRAVIIGTRIISSHNDYAYTLKVSYERCLYCKNCMQSLIIWQILTQEI